ncbi:hypothetical protein [Paludisphaera mucosa]|uniref:Terminase n=1 Tax=Paludisphaera mucosa TaxID=3030827 RepID=A0ABT6FM08_9BACT|nr:hypothetical protein [Paludisphaera mucosa]MDG3008531.1 hypothetical protein [Paludisphaera mucosa]
MATIKRSKAPRGWKAKFVAALRQVAVVRHAAEAAGVHKSTAYREKARDKKFDEAWEDALDDATDVLELEARRRAVLGVEREVYVRTGTDQDGRPIFTKQTVREYSDKLLMFLLSAYRPERFRERFDWKGLLADAAAAQRSEALDR